MKKRYGRLLACCCLIFSLLMGAVPVCAAEPAAFYGTDRVGGVSVSDKEEGEVCRLEEGEQAEWTLTVPREGDYWLDLRYQPLPDTGDSVRVAVTVDGEDLLPAGGAFSLERLWANEGEDRTDLYGNQIRPEQVELVRWQDRRLSAAGLSDGAVVLHLSAGAHALCVRVQQERVLLAAPAAVPVTPVPDYAEKKAEYERQGYTLADTAPIVLEAERGSVKSAQNLYPLADRSSPAVSPSDPGRILYNAVGGSQWKTEGQWIEWQVEVETAGLYTVGFFYKQDAKSDAVSVRELTIDGELPFAQAAELCFPYTGGWEEYTLGEGEEPYRFYLERGAHTLRLCVGEGPYRPILQEADRLITELNRIYRRIVVVTGVTPDVYRTYEFDVVIPDVLADMKVASGELKELEQAIRQAGFSGNQGTDVIRRVYFELDKMTEDSDTIARLLSEYRDRISAMGTWRNQLVEQPLTLDRIFLSGEERQEVEGTSLWSAILYHLKQFLYSFVNDYSQIGRTEENVERSIHVWMSSGRDQAQILKSLISQRFTPDTGVAVELELVAADSLLPALLAGTGPDVTLGLAMTEPLNLALRKAVVDLKRFPDYGEVAARFYPESVVPFQFNGGVWALPDTLSFPMLFYRKDILEELALTTEDLATTDGLIKRALPVIQKNGLNLGITAGSFNYLWILYQMGGDLYDPAGRTTLLGESEAIRAMSLYEMLYSQYQLPLAFDAANRFRSGEMPVLMADYLFYNQLTVFAPEIAGAWSMLPVPGTVTETGELRAIAPITVTGSVIMQGAEDPQAAWEFVKWWLSARTQTDYGRDLESIVGTAARYNTANIEAMDTVKWDPDMKKSLVIQRRQLRGIPQVPGGYLTDREFSFAFRDIVYDAKNVRVAMSEAAKNIDKELARKREEYGLE